MEQAYVFVYGTLKQDSNGRHHPLLKACILTARGTIEARLYDLGDYPGAIAAEGEKLEGEVYEVPPLMSERILAALDKYEGDEYERNSVEVACPDSSINAYCYFLKNNPSEDLRIEKFNAPDLHGETLT